MMASSGSSDVTDRKEGMFFSPDDIQSLVSSAVQAATQAVLTGIHQQSATKARRPSASKGMTLEQWNFFTNKWSSYKTAAPILSDRIPQELMECCDESLQFCLYRMLGDSYISQDEATLLSHMKNLAVTDVSVIVSRVNMRHVTQLPNENIHNFVARLRGQADLCNFTVSCHDAHCNAVNSYADEEIKDQLCVGLADSEIQQSLLMSQVDTMSLDQVIKFVAAKESGRSSHTTLSRTQTTISAQAPAEEPCNARISSYKRNNCANTSVKNSSLRHSECGWCGKQGHGAKAPLNVRRDKCPSFHHKCSICGKVGHFEKKCMSTRRSVDGIDAETIVLNNIGLIADISSRKCFSGKIKHKIIVPHTEYQDLVGWASTECAPDPSVTVSIDTCGEAYRSYCLQQPSSQPASFEAIADTGARTTVCGTTLLHKLGLKVSDLIPVQQRLCGANKSPLRILGGLFLSISARGPHGSERVAKQLCYVQAENPDRFYLSQTACKQLGIIPDVFPQVDAMSDTKRQSSSSSQAVGLSSTTETASVDMAPCGCPKRLSAPAPPASPPFPLTDVNCKALETWLLNYYGSSTFNTCEHQTLPHMTGPPLRIFVDPDVAPVAVHTPISVPVHWREQVKASLDRDVRLGVLERVPVGEPVSWCSRMVIVAKKDGTPRRTVDLQALNKASVRQTHHTVPPFQQAVSIPSNTVKTVLDAWNGYHSVPIHPADRHYTTFITPWGRYRYRTAPQGYLAAGDAYTRRFDDLITSVPNKTKCIDDTLLWASDTATAFHQTCHFLSLCGSNGIVLNPKKFQFARREVEFAGFVIDQESVRPTHHYLQAIASFPTPRSITDVRSWYGLVNQAAYTLSKLDALQPFRELLKPKNSFYWDDTLQALFEKTKADIISSVKEGVQIFDVHRQTCLTTDWSRNGTGFVLRQKYCQCIDLSPSCCATGWKTVFIGGQFNNSAEANYAPVEGECLAVVKALHKARYFVSGCSNLLVATDHKPLLKVLGDRKLENIDNPRLLRLKEKTLRYRFKMIYVPGKLNSIADATSRYSQQLSSNGGIVQLSKLCVIADTANDHILENVRDVSIGSLASATPITAVTWDQLQEETVNDPVMSSLLNVVSEGFPESLSDVPVPLHPYHRFREYLSVVDSVILYKDRIIVPAKLRQCVLENLHAAHQGVHSMTLRAQQSVFWPGITNDIYRIRAACTACHAMAPSQPNLPPTEPVHPQYPFQYVCSDFFQVGETHYVVIVDRYSNWPVVVMVKHGDGARQLISALKSFAETYGIPEELSTDGGSQYTAGETQAFLRDWGIQHRVSSTAFPHSNTRAEVGVKTVKRLLTGNTGPNGQLDTDAFRRALLTYKNTPDPDTKLSPAQIVYGRQLRDFVPSYPVKFRPSKEWAITFRQRELALKRRHARACERLTAYTHRPPPLKVGDTVYLQNQTGQRANRWDRSGRVVEVRQHDQYVVRIDGSGRTTVRNRKFLRRFFPTVPTSPHVHSCPSDFPTDASGSLPERVEQGCHLDPDTVVADGTSSDVPTDTQESTTGELRENRNDATATGSESLSLQDNQDQNSTQSTSVSLALRRSDRLGRGTTSRYNDYDLGNIWNSDLCGGGDRQ